MILKRSINRKSIPHPPPPVAPDRNAHTLEICNIREGKYRYMEDLLQLDSCTPAGQSSLPPTLARIVTPMNLDEWRKELITYPDQRLPRYLLHGFTHGFRVGFARSSKLRTSPKNMRSAAEHPTIITDYIQTEQAAGRIVGPVGHLRHMHPPAHCSPIGVIPKKRSSKWRLIVDLSAPEGRSVNDGINKEICSLHYAGIDEAIAIVQRLGKGCLLAKLDLKKRLQDLASTSG